MPPRRPPVIVVGPRRKPVVERVLCEQTQGFRRMHADPVGGCAVQIFEVSQFSHRRHFPALGWIDPRAGTFHFVAIRPAGAGQRGPRIDRVGTMRAIAVGEVEAEGHRVPGPDELSKTEPVTQRPRKQGKTDADAGGYRPIGELQITVAVCAQGIENQDSGEDLQNRGIEKRRDPPKQAQAGRPPASPGDKRLRKVQVDQNE